MCEISTLVDFCCHFQLQLNHEWIYSNVTAVLISSLQLRLEDVVILIWGKYEYNENNLIFMARDSSKKIQAFFTIFLKESTKT